MTVDKTEALLESLVTKLLEKGQQSGFTEAQLEQLLTRVGSNTASAMRTSLKPENPDHPGISAFSYPEGERARPKPDLRVKTFFCGMEEHKDRLTPSEILAYNAITEDQKRRTGDWTATIKDAGQAHESLHVALPCDTVDQRMGLPPLELILIEMNGGPSTADLGGMIATIRKLEQELAEARAQGFVAAEQAALSA